MSTIATRPLTSRTARINPALARAILPVIMTSQVAIAEAVERPTPARAEFNLHDKYLCKLANNSGLCRIKNIHRDTFNGGPLSIQFQRLNRQGSPIKGKTFTAEVADVRDRNYFIPVN